jgi:hypothetical protein
MGKIDTTSFERNAVGEATIVFFYKEYGDAIFGSTSLVALQRQQAILQLTLMDEWRLLRALTCVAVLRSLCWRHLICNLPANVPKGGPYCPSDAAFCCYYVPSGYS